MNVIVVLFTAALLTPQHPSMPAGMSHEEHLKQMQKDEALKQRGADAMGFDQDAAEHHFIIEADGGSIQVTVKTDSDPVVMSEIRAHLRTIAEEFARGDFGKPFQTHNETPAGVAVMKKAAQKIRYAYEEVPGGGAVRLRTTDVKALKAIHEFLRYQISEHHTGDSLRPKR